MVHHLSVLILLIRCYSFKFLIRLYILVTIPRIQFQETKFIKSEQKNSLYLLSLINSYPVII